MYWLITYTQWTGSQHKTVTKPISMMHPGDWLLAMLKKYPDSQTTLVFAIEITGKQCKELVELI